MREGLPQFSTAEFAAGTQASCRACSRPIQGAFFQVNGQSVCEGCTQTMKMRLPRDSRAAFVRAALFGIGAALLGLLLYVVFALATGLVIGFVSLAVGFLVGKALVSGSGGVRGRRYQVLAVVLTYCAVSLAAVPLAVYQMHQHPLAAQSAPAERTIGENLGVLTLLGLASPFLDLRNPAHGLIGLLILSVGLRISWKLTAAPRLQIVGPLRLPQSHPVTS